MLQENIDYGQRIHNYKVLIDDTLFYTSGSMGHKKIILLNQNVTASKITLNIYKWLGTQVFIENIAIFEPCTDGN